MFYLLGSTSFIRALLSVVVANRQQLPKAKNRKMIPHIAIVETENKQTKKQKSNPIHFYYSNVWDRFSVFCYK